MDRGSANGLRLLAMPLLSLFALLGLFTLMNLFAPAAGAQGHRSGGVVEPCQRQEALLDTRWLFHHDEIPGGAQANAAQEAAWEPVTLPHDWAIQGPRQPDAASGGAGGFAPMGLGWYKVHLPANPGTCAGQRTLVRFDGIMANSDVWINGHLLGHRPNGYVSLTYDLTPWLKGSAAADNLLAVRADNSAQPSSRFYQGAGLYRHVHLLRLPALHFETDGTAVRTPRIDAEAAEVAVSSEIRNESSSSRTAALRVTLLDAAGHAVSSPRVSSTQAIPAGQTGTFEITVALPHPLLWSPDHPALYRARVEVLEASHSGDAMTMVFGVREDHFDADRGFVLNGVPLKIKGVALHSDVGALGMAAPLGVWEHRLRAMRWMGANAIRTAHNPVAPEFLDLCDRMGFLVLDEFFDVWTVGKNPYDYHLYFKDWSLKDTHDTVRRDRNHPSIIAWSAGNEIHDTPHPEVAKPILAALIAQYHQDDPTRPVTQALFRPNVSHDYQDGLADMLDVIGQNYRPAELLAAHEEKPSRKILGTENIHDRATWLAVRDHPAYSGMFLWSGTDYLGESRHWPLFSDVSGMNDRTDFPKPDSLERESWWADRSVVHMVRRTAPPPKAPADPGYELDQYRPRQTAFPDWTPLNLAPHTEQVEVYSNCPEVTLSLNGTSLGSQALPADASPRTWQVAFAPGTLRAACTDHGTSRAGEAAPGQGAGSLGAGSLVAGSLVQETMVQETLHTAGAPAALRLSLESPCLGTAFDGVAEVRATVIDAKGTAVPGAAVPVTFSVSGPVTLLATDNADSVYSAPFASPLRTTLDGRAVAFLRGTAGAKMPRAAVQAQSPGLASALLQLPAASAACAVSTDALQ